MIRVSNLCVSLGGNEILSGLNMKVETGQKVALSGVSGGGKTTLLKTLLGRHVPTEGVVEIAGLQFCPEHLAAIRKQLFYLPQNVVATGDETVAMFLEQPYLLKVSEGQTYSRTAALGWFERLQLKPALMEQPLAQLSGGERKRLGLLRGLLMERKLLLLDEPTSGVDPSNRDMVVNLILSLTETTVVAVTHDEQLMARSDVHYQLVNGKLQERGSDGYQ